MPNPCFKTAIEWAGYYADLPVRELAGKKNRSPEIDEANRFVGNALGDPYCAAGSSLDFHKAILCGAKGEAPFKTGSSQAVKRWGHERLVNGVMRYFEDPQRLLTCRGACAGWTNLDDPSHGHTFKIAKRLTSGGGLLIGVGTIEWNTDPIAHDRDGDGVYRVTRNEFHGGRLWHGQKLIWFVDMTGIAGGDWWPEIRK